MTEADYLLLKAQSKELWMILGVIITTVISLASGLIVFLVKRYVTQKDKKDEKHDDEIREAREKSENTIKDLLEKQAISYESINNKIDAGFKEQQLELKIMSNYHSETMTKVNHIEEQLKNNRGTIEKLFDDIKDTNKRIDVIHTGSFRDMSAGFEKMAKAVIESKCK
jgi:mannitol-specific phosphotransferase system IIBC component